MFRASIIAIDEKAPKFRGFFIMINNSFNDVLLAGIMQLRTFTSRAANFRCRPARIASVSFTKKHPPEGGCFY